MSRPDLEAVLDALADMIAERVADRIASRDGTAEPSAGLSVRDAARRLGVGITSVRELIARGSLRVTRIGRRIVVPVSEVQRLLAEGAVTDPATVQGTADVVELPAARAIEAARRAARRGAGA